MSKLLNQAKKSAKEGRVADQTAEGPAFERELAPEGKWPARFIGYVETGNRKGGAWKGKQKPDTRKAWLYFKLLAKKLAKEVEVEGKGKVTIYPIVRAMVDVKVGEKANLTKLFKKMAAGDDYTHIAEMLGQAFLVKVTHNDNGKEGADHRVYENIRTEDEGWTVYPPMREVYDEDEDETVMKPVNVPDVDEEELMLLLWDDPTPEQWDSIEGRPYTYKDGETEHTFDGGYIQYVCVNQAIDFKGSPLETMLSGGELPDMTPEVLDDDLGGHDGEPTGGSENPTDGVEDEDMGLDDLDGL